MALVETYLDEGGNTCVLDSLRITPSFGSIYYQTVDLGYPTSRVSSIELPQADGSFNQTQYSGDRSVSVAVTVRQDAFGPLPQQYSWDSSIGWNSASWWVRYISGWVTAARRVTLYMRDDSGMSFWMPLVGNQAPSAVGRESSHNREMLLNFTNPTGKLYAFDESENATLDGRTSVRIRRAGDDVIGRFYAEDYPKTYPPLPGGSYVDYKGSVPNGFIARIHVLGTGGLHSPIITVTAPDGSVSTVSLWPTYVIPVGTIVEFDTNAKTVTSYLATSPDTIVDRDEYKYGPLTWPTLKPGRAIGQPPGRNPVSFEYTVNTGDPTDTYLEVIYSSAHLL